MKSQTPILDMILRLSSSFLFMLSLVLFMKGETADATFTAVAAIYSLLKAQDQVPNDKTDKP